MFTYNDILDLARHERVVRAYEKFLSLRHADYPDMNYVGLNFSSGRLCSVKFYFSVYRRITPRDVSAFLPHVDDFMRYYHLWEDSKVRSAAHTGCAFSVKFKANREPEVGFHYRLVACREAYELVGVPETLPFSGEELGTRPGINYEYAAGGEANRRRYYYLEKQSQKDYIAARFARPFASECRLCEFTEWHGGSKVILWTPDYTEHYLSRPTYFHGEAVTMLRRLRDDFDLISAMDGFYEDEDVISSYFFNTLGPKTGNINQGKENFHMDTLRLFLD